uniref:Uncharacterized protein n=1 Tax=Rhizophora mucronata TaxID=61149 RepID=A0A2P2QKN9_RHIMU
MRYRNNSYYFETCPTTHIQYSAPFSF